MTLIGNITGPVISSAVLWMNTGEGNSTGSNVTADGNDEWYLTDEEISMYCGINDCPGNNVTNPIAEEPEERKVRLRGIWHRETMTLHTRFHEMFHPQFNQGMILGQA